MNADKGKSSGNLTRPSYTALSAQIDLPSMEHQILEFWRSGEIFAKSTAARDIPGAREWTFYEGPPTANGLPGTHHIEARVFKDLFPRFHTMKGAFVPRFAGWDCHGLPVELAVEKELGFTGKSDIEKFGVAEFNDKCRTSVQRHVGAFVEMTERMGFWVDFEKAYWTMSPEYIDSVWWSISEIWKKELLVQDHRVAPYCPRCGTGLSDHELAQGYENITDPSVFVAFPITSGHLAEIAANLLVWTTTPWTLVSNTAIAVHPEVKYLVAKTEENEIYVVAEPLIKILGENLQIIEEISGKDLEHTKYKRPFDFVEIPEAHFVVLADYVTTEDGTGLVHQSPAFGAEDLIVCRKYNLPVVNPIAGDGKFLSEVPVVGGMFFKDSDKVLVKELKKLGVLYRHLQYQHSYPHCWRCHTPLMYYAQPSWYIRTTAIKEALMRENTNTDWHPETIKSGRYGDWLENNIDWALSRNRYWGTPLPIWRCDEGHLECIGSRKELSARTGNDLDQLDPHRPFVDEIYFDCQQCGGQMKRVPEVIDCWYDSGAMPFAQLGYPHKPGSIEAFEKTYPADFICEAIDQTRGWFYTMMTIGTLVFDKSSYKTVLCLGHILDKDGRKMSKHLGNVLEPMPLMDKHGADAVRWYMLAAGSPWASRRVGHDAISDVVRKTLLTYWNTVSFLTLYGKAADFKPIGILNSKNTLDRWIISQLNRTIEECDRSFTDFDSQSAGRALATFIDELSNWYVRRSRRRFWDGDAQALETLHHCIKSLTLIMAPMVPFITEKVWQDVIKVVQPDVVDSVHLADWPIFNQGSVDLALGDAVAATRRLVELGRAARAESGVKIRQPLGRALISGFARLSHELQSEIADELNVHRIEDLSTADGELVDYSIKANFRTLGTKYGANVQEIATALSKLNAADVVSKVRSGQPQIISGDSSFEVNEEDLIITETPRTGWAVASHDGETVAIDLTITPELHQEGVIREIIRAIQEERKNAGFDVSDRIKLIWNGSAEVSDALESGIKLISEEVLALEVEKDSSLKLADEELELGLKLLRL